MFLVVGLGNPGKEYASHRHNIGFMAADAIASAFSFGAWSKKFRGHLAEGKIGSEKVFLLKPQTFMNLSGESVGECASFYKIPVENIIVIHDELDFDFGVVKLKRSGGSGGHNGLKSIESHIGNNFLRVRFGIGKAAHDNADYVLSNFSKHEIIEVEKMLPRLALVLFPMIEKFHEMGANNLKFDLNDPEQKIAVSANPTKIDSRLRGNEKE